MTTFTITTQIDDTITDKNIKFSASDISGGNKFTFGYEQATSTCSNQASLKWIITDSTGLQYNAYPPLSTSGSNITFTVTTPCTSVSTPQNDLICVMFNNITSKIATITNVPEPGIDAKEALYVSTRLQSALLPDGTTWALPDMTQFVVSGNHLYFKYPVVIMDTNTTNNFETTYKPYVTLNGIFGLGGGFIGSGIMLVIFFKMLSSPKLKKPDDTTGNIMPDLQTIETPKTGKKWLYFLYFLLFVYISVATLLFVAAGYILESKYATYDQCSAKDGFGVIWRWATPTSTIKKILCTVFGSCECSSNVLENMCIEASATEGTFEWDSNAAAQSTDIHNTCFCCAGKKCIDINNNTCV